MNQKNKELWVIPSIVTLIGGLVLIPVAAWLTNVPMRTIVTFAGIKDLWFSSMPAWIVLGVIVISGILAICCWLLANELQKALARIETLTQEAVVARGQIENSRRDHAAEIESLRRPVPRLEAVWEETSWGEDTVDGQPAIYLSGWAFFSIHYGASTAVLVQASVNGSDAVSIPPIHLRAGSDRKQFFTNVMPPIGTQGEPLQASITLIDTRNRHYVLPERTFQWSSVPGGS